MNKQKSIKSRKKVTCFIVLLLLFCFVSKDSSMLSAAMVEDKKWSFEFNNLPASDVLNKINEVSGVEIVLNGETDKELITKSYKDYTIDNILIDIFQGESFAALFQYNEQGLSSVDIWVLPKNASIGEMVDIYKLIREKKAAVKTKTSVIEEMEQPFDGRYRITVSPGAADDDMKAPNDTTQKVSQLPSFKVANSSNSEIDEVEDIANYEVVDVPPFPYPEKFGGLEPPPMPPGIILF